MMLDARRVYLLASDEAIASGAINIPQPYTNNVAKSWIASHKEEYKKGNSLILAITMKETGLLIGSISLYINKKHQHAELGYWIGKEYWRNGYCTEAVSCVINYGFVKLNLHKIFAYYLCRNIASGKVLKKNRFQQEGILREHVKYKQVFEDIECWSLLHSEYTKN